MAARSVWVYHGNFAVELENVPVPCSGCKLMKIAAEALRTLCLSANPAGSEGKPAPGWGLYAPANLLNSAAVLDAKFFDQLASTKMKLGFEQLWMGWPKSKEEHDAWARENEILLKVHPHKLHADKMVWDDWYCGCGQENGGCHHKGPHTVGQKIWVCKECGGGFAACVECGEFHRKK
eukprot:m51a1_g7077 hypothetical protein (178) ;mRNA; f:222439-223152